MRYLKSDKLYCFSPPIMLATFIIEIACAIYVIARYKLTPITRPAVALLVCLAIFQLAEYNVCETAWGIDSMAWARVGYVAITLLPAIGIQLATRIAGQKRPLLVGASYASAILFASFFLFVSHGMQSQQCLGNYVIFTTAEWTGIPYIIYYYGWLMATVIYAGQAGRAMTQRPKKMALYGLALGYCAFIVPTTWVNIVDPSTISGIPSIMCGFAVILAIVLTGFVLPRYYSR